MKSKNAKRFFWLQALIVLALAAFLLPACDSGDDDDDDDDDLSISFTADAQGAEGEIALVNGGVDGEKLRVHVVAGGAFESAYGLAFRLLYDTDVMMLDSAVVSDALKPDGVDLLQMATEKETDELIVGVSRAGTYSGADLAAGDTICTLVFRAVGKGTTRLDFKEEKRALIDNRFDRLEVTGWIGGDVQVK